MVLLAAGGWEEQRPEAAEVSIRGSGGSIRGSGGSIRGSGGSIRGSGGSIRGSRPGVDRPQRRKHKSKNRSSRCTPQLRAQGTSATSTASVSERMETKVPWSTPHCGHREVKQRGSKHTVASSRHSRTSSSSRLLETHDDAAEDSDTELSLSQKPFLVSSSRFPPQLDLRPEVIEDDDSSSYSHNGRGQGHGGFDYPDFLPPPFNLWSLSQLAVFYNMEGGAAHRPRPVGPLERYLERLLQLELHQIQTVQEELEKLDASELRSGCHRPSAATSSCLSSPKCILQCQRAFPLTFLSSLASHSDLLFGCTCTFCWIHYSTCSSSGCHSMHTNGRQSRQSPMPEHSRGPMSLPKRSYSESRVHSSDRSHPIQRFRSPTKTSNYLIRMQALGNIRKPIHSAPGRPASTSRDSTDPTAKDSTMGVFRKRSVSEQRKGGAERQHNRSGKRQSGSECRKGRTDQHSSADFKNQNIKPESVCASRGSINSPNSRPSRPKAVEFVTQ